MNEQDTGLRVTSISEGYVLDHIKAGMSLSIFNQLKLNESEYTVAIIRNARSHAMGRKDILKVECPVGAFDLGILAFVDSNITVNIIKDGKLFQKKKMELPEKMVNILKCRNPRCISSIEQELPHIFILKDGANKVYRCKYCDEKYGEMPR